MGLCKCNKRKVTNQFCFEHRVNVCEFCMVNSHPKCIVQSYLQWLQDSDCDPRCQLCKTSLQLQSCVRLVCYHVFHWSCLDEYASRLPANTAPAGYTCPTCNQCIFPPANLVSAVGDALTSSLQQVNWARAGLGLPLLDVSGFRQSVTSSAGTANAAPLSINGLSELSGGTDHVWKPPAASRADVSVVDISGSAFHRDLSNSLDNSGGGGGRKFVEECQPLLNDVDSSENKYRRRSAMEWFQRWWRLMSGRPRAGSIYRRYLMFAILVVVALVSLITLLRWISAGIGSDQNDLMFDPHFNPNVRVRE